MFYFFRLPVSATHNKNKKLKHGLKPSQARDFLQDGGTKMYFGMEFFSASS